MLYKVILDRKNEHVATVNVADPLTVGERIDSLTVDGDEAPYLVTKIEPRPEIAEDTFVVGTVWVHRVV